MSGTKIAKSTAAQNKPTCGGTAKKAGLAPSVGFFMSSNPNLIRANNSNLGVVCIPSRTIQTQKYGYSATHGGNMG